MDKPTGRKIEEFCDDHFSTIGVGALVVSYLIIIGISSYQTGKANKRMEDKFTTALIAAVASDRGE